MRTVRELKPADFPGIAPREFEEWRDEFVAAEDARRPIGPMIGIGAALGGAQWFFPSLRGVALPAGAILIVVIFGYAIMKITPHHRRAQTLQKAIGLTMTDLRAALRKE